MQQTPLYRSAKPLAWSVFHIVQLERYLLMNYNLKPYKYQICHRLKPTDYDAGLTFAAWLLSQPENITQYFIASDEAYFYLTQALNKQNNRMWSESRPDEWIEEPLHGEKIHVCFFL